MPFGFFVRPSGLQRRLKSPSIPDESSPRAFFDVTISLCSCVFIVPSSNLFPKSLMYHARSAWWLETKSYARIVPPLPRRASATPKKNVSCFFDLAGVKFFLKMERTFFFGVLPSKYSGRWRNNADEVLAKLFFGERICQNFGSFVFEFGSRKRRRRGLGRNPPLAPLFSFWGIRAGVSAGYVLVDVGRIIIGCITSSPTSYVGNSTNSKLNPASFPSLFNCCFTI